jgi:subtilisin-like proprotein convertase family protein
VKVENVKKLIKLAVSTDTGGGGGTTKDFNSTPNVSIPDNNPTGASADVTASGVTAPKGLTVSVKITHTYSGDLTLTLLKDGTAVKTLRQNQGGGTANIIDTYTLSAAELGSAPNGKWTLKVVDNAAQDTGTIDTFNLSFSL